MKTYTIVLAGNKKEYDRYISDNGLDNDSHNYIYGGEPRCLMGMIAERIEIIGTFWERKDASMLKEYADSQVVPPPKINQP